MKLGFGLYKHMLTAENYAFARQCSATHIVAHLTDYFAKSPSLPGQQKDGWGYTQGDKSPWTKAGLQSLKSDIEAADLQLAAIENFDPAHWYDVLLGGPERDRQLDDLAQIIRNMGDVGIPVMGYNFSIAGVCGWYEGELARAGARSVGLREEDALSLSPVPNGMIWNMVYDENAPEGHIPPVSSDQIWENYHYFLDVLLPVAEKAGVRLAAHPDDPPMPVMRGHARLVYQPRFYDKSFRERPSPSNCAELCLGTVAEMSESTVYDEVERWCRDDKIGYIHLRNVKGKVPDYREVFIDEGDIDVQHILRILKDNSYSGVIIPDHTPQMSCNASWHAGMAYAMGYIRASLKSLGVAA
ncbi:mannonate dehydratase [Parasalinivibrio latis]|uniref:mannonate dehydratase n=1 Tax=Parasalinivibrio latis TaxID=2952610 RepID=UPI0030E27B0C